MDILFEQNIVQNAALGGEILWYAANETFETSGRTHGIPFPLAFIILPMAFHRQTALTLSTKTQPGAMYKALSENREIIVGLQNRMEAMSHRTFEALSIGFDSKLLLLDPDHEKTIIPGRKSPAVVHVSEDIRSMTAAAKRIGQAFFEMTLPQLVVQLNLRF